MSWAKKITKNNIPPETAEYNISTNQTENKRISMEQESISALKSGQKAFQMSKEDIWEYIKMRIISYAPVMIPLVYLPVVHIKGKASILCNGKEIYISDRFWQLPLDDIMYITIKEFTQVLLGFRVEKNIEISDNVKDKDVVRTEIEMLLERVHNMLCDTLLLSCPGDAGISPSLISPSEELLNYIHESFGIYSVNVNQYIKYIDKTDSLAAFKNTWGKINLNSVYDQLVKGYNLCRQKDCGSYADIKFSICPNSHGGLGTMSKNIADISYIPNGNFLIDISPELTKQTIKLLNSSSLQNSEESLEDGGEEASDNYSDTASKAPENKEKTSKKGKPDNSENMQNTNKNSRQSMQNGNRNNPANNLSSSECLLSGKKGNSENTDNKNENSSGSFAQNENKDGFDNKQDRNESKPDNGYDKNSDDYASEFSAVLNKEQASMDMNVYKDILSKAKRYLDDSPIAYGKDSFGDRITEIYNKLYKISSVWWKKAQNMIMSYVPDVNSSYRRPNKKFAMTEFVLPSQCEKAQSFDVDRLRVFLDSSGSMTSEDFKIFKSLIKSAQNSFPRDTLAYEFNTVVTPMKCVRGKIIGSPSHTGGTDIGCVTNFISTQPDKGKALNIVVTDGGFNWRRLISYMKKEDRLSKFLFILTTANRSYLTAVKEVNVKRLKVLLISNYGNF